MRKIFIALLSNHDNMQNVDHTWTWAQGMWLCGSALVRTHSWDLKEIYIMIMMMMVNGYDDYIDEDYDIFQKYIFNFSSNKNIKILQETLAKITWHWKNSDKHGDPSVHVEQACYQSNSSEDNCPEINLGLYSCPDKYFANITNIESQFSPENFEKVNLWQCSRTVDDAMMMAMMITIWGYEMSLKNLQIGLWTKISGLMIVMMMIVMMTRTSLAARPQAW